jgi:curli biogenesis system outer membrane secretion channel CsgG
MHLLSSRKVLYYAILVTVFCFLFSSVTVYGAPKRIGVTRFETNNFYVAVPGGGSYDIGLGASDMLATELSKNKNFQVIEREQIRSVLQEQGFGASGAVDPKTSAKVGKLLGLKYIVYGKILSAGAEAKHTELMGVMINKLSVKVQIAVRMIDTTTGAIVWADQVEGKIDKKGGGIAGVGATGTRVSASVYDEAIHSAIDQIVSRINQQAPTEGNIVKISGNKLYLDIGIEQGIQPGQKFTVFREGDVITNAAGKVIGVDKTDICTIKITRVEGNMSIAEIVDKKPPLLHQGDKIRSI